MWSVQSWPPRRSSYLVPEVHELSLLDRFLPSPDSQDERTEYGDTVHLREPFLYKPFAKQVVALRTGRALEHQINIEKRAWHILANRPFVTGCPKNDVALQGRIPRLPSRSVGKRAISSRVSCRFCPLQPPAPRAARPSSNFDEGKATPTPASPCRGRSCLVV